MFTHVFYIQRLGAFKRGSYNLLTKKLEILAKDLYEARKQVEQDYPDWDVSMCWPKTIWLNTPEGKKLVAV
jgi:hypothetical protein